MVSICTSVINVIPLVFPLNTKTNKKNLGWEKKFQKKNYILIIQFELNIFNLCGSIPTEKYNSYYLNNHQATNKIVDVKQGICIKGGK